MATCVEGESCGVNSNCVNSQCVCEEGFFPLQDFGFFIEKVGDGFNVATLDCNGSKAASFVLYTILLLVLVVSLFSHLCRIKRKSQAKRLIPYLVGMTLFAILSFIKLLNVEEKFFGEDMFLSVIFALTIPDTVIAIQVYLLRYLILEYKLLAIKPSEAGKTLRNYEISLYFSSFLSVVGAILMIVGSAVEGNGIKRNIFRITFGLMTIPNFIEGVLNFHLGQELAKNMNFLLNSKAERKLIEVLVRAEGMKWNTSMTLWLMAACFLFASVTETTLQLFAYVLPIQSSIIMLGTTLNVQFNKGKLGTIATTTKTKSLGARNNTSSQVHRSAGRPAFESNPNMTHEDML